MELERLKEPFHRSQIHWRVGSTNVDAQRKTLKWGEVPLGMPLAYIDARDVQDRLDNVCGMGKWQSEQPWSDGKKLACRIGIEVTDGNWVWKGNGAGDTAVEGDKGAFSDAFKRAAVEWGIGRYLYGMKIPRQPLISIDKREFSQETIKALNEEYDRKLMPGRKENFLESYSMYRVVMDSMMDAINAEKLEAAAEYWAQIPPVHQERLWLAPTSGGILDQDMKKIIRSTNFRVMTKEHINAAV